MQVANTVAWAEHSGDLRKAIQDGKRIIITTVEKFPYVVPDIGATHKTNNFAVIIDEAHSGQNGRNSAQMNLALSGLASLYISQVKRKCGLEVGKNYNMPKSVDSKQPQCPPEKETAIMEALEYFQMI